MKKLITLLFILPIIAYSQDRINEEMPKAIGNEIILSNCSGWMKNNLGKWVSASNAIPNNDYESKGSLHTCDNWDKIAYFKVGYNNESYYLIYETQKDYFVNKGKIPKFPYNKIIENYTTYFWLIKDSSYQKIDFSTLREMQKIVFPYIVQGTIPGFFYPPSISKILIELKKSLRESKSRPYLYIEELDNIELKYKISNISQVQFILHGIIPNTCLIDNDDFDNYYYETSSDIFKSFFEQLTGNKQ